jgi:hypothetical protein
MQSCEQAPPVGDRSHCQSRHVSSFMEPATTDGRGWVAGTPASNSGDSGSNLGRTPASLNKIFLWFSSASPGEHWDRTLKLGHGLLPSEFFSIYNYHPQLQFNCIALVTETGSRVAQAV